MMRRGWLRRKELRCITEEINNTITKPLVKNWRKQTLKGGREVIVEREREKERGREREREREIQQKMTFT